MLLYNVLHGHTKVGDNRAMVASILRDVSVRRRRRGDRKSRDHEGAVTGDGAPFRALLFPDRNTDSQSRERDGGADIERPRFRLSAIVYGESAQVASSQTNANTMWVTCCMPS